MRRWSAIILRIVRVAPALCVALWCMQASALSLDAAVERWPLSADVEIAFEPEAALEVAAVAAGALDAAFRPAAQQPPHLGFFEGAVWMRFSLDNPAAEIARLMLSVRFPYLDRVTLYARDGAGGLTRVERGALAALTPQDRAAHYPAFPLTLAAGETAAFWLRIESRSLLLAPVEVAREAVFWRGAMRDQALFGAALGAMLAVSLYVLSVWRAIPDPAFPAFIAFALASAAYVGVASGLAKFWLWPDGALPGGTVDGGAVYFAVQGVLIAAAAWFFRRFLRTARCHRPCHWMLQGVSVAGLATCFAPLLPPSLTAPLFAMAAGGGAIILFGVSLYLWRRGVAGAGVTVLGWGLSQAAMLFLFLRVHDVTPYTPLNHYLAALATLFAVLFFALAVSARVRREQARLQALERWRDGQSEFFASMSHDLRTPLNAVIGFSDVLRMKGLGKLGAAEFTMMVEHIRNAGAHMLHLVNRILEHARLDAGQYVLQRGPCDLATLTQECVAMLTGLAREADVSLSADLAPGSLDGDPHALKQAVLNVVSNAVKFTAAGGAVTVTLRDGADGWLTLRVADTGVGIAPADIAKVLSRYGQAGDAAQRRKGAGLGLPMAKGLVELHGGTLTLDSRLGAGTTVTLQLPAQAARQAAEKAVAQAAQNGAARATA